MTKEQLQESVKTLNDIWPEVELCDKLNLPVTKSGRSAQLSNWIRGGLQYVEKSGRRYFFEPEVVEYLIGRKGVELPKSRVRKTNSNPLQGVLEEI